MSMTGLGCRGSVSVSAPASASSEDSCWTIRARSPHAAKERLDGSVRGSVLVRGEEDGAGVVRALQQEPDGGEESVEVRGLVVEDVRAEHEVDAARGEAEGGGVEGAPVEREDVHAGRVEAVGVARRGEVREHLGLARGVGEGHVRAELGEEQPGKRGARTELHDARRGSGVGEVPRAMSPRVPSERLRGRPGVLPVRLRSKHLKRYNLRANAIPGIPERVRQRRPRTSHPSARV